MSTHSLDTDKAVRERYSEASKNLEPSLCCPVDYDDKYLKVIPNEVIVKDYGCGDPSQYLKKGETVLDLGCGGGKICFIAAQIVGAEGKVIGVDINDNMLKLAQDAAQIVGENIGYHNVEFYKGKIEDLSLNRQLLEDYLQENPIYNEKDLSKLEDYVAKIRLQRPMIANDSVDVVVSNCVLNLVNPKAKKNLFKEIYRVLKRGGRAIISDIVCDEPVSESMQNDANLWSGCISGAFEEYAFLKAFEDAGFYGIEVLKRDTKPWQTIEGIEFRALTVCAWKGKEGDCWDHKEALIYKGPFKSVVDDDGHIFKRGQRSAVCRKTFEIYSKDPYKEFFYPVLPLVEVSSSEAKAFSCTHGALARSARETKGQDYNVTSMKSENCEKSGNCC